MKAPNFCTTEMLRYLDGLEKERSMFDELQSFSMRLKERFEGLSIPQAIANYIYWFMINKHIILK